MILSHMGQFDWYCAIRINLSHIDTYGSVWLILLHMDKFDWYYHIWVSLIDFDTYGWVCLIYTGQFDRYCHIHPGHFDNNTRVGLIDIFTFDSAG